MRQHGDGIAEHLLRAGVTEREAEVLSRMREVKERKLAEAQADEAPADANVEANVGTRRRLIVETFDDD